MKFCRFRVWDKKARRHTCQSAHRAMDKRVSGTPKSLNKNRDLCPFSQNSESPRGQQACDWFEEVVNG